MPANITINLLGDSEMEHTPVGRIVSWAITYGRYIMIGTEIVVLLAFISRFSLDRKLTDLKEEVTQKQDIITANLAFEADIRTLQDKLEKIKKLTEDPAPSIDLLPQFQTILPPGTYISALDLTKNQLTVEAISGSTGSFAQFITNLKNSNTITNIVIGDISRDPILGIEFTFTAQVIKMKTK